MAIDSASMATGKFSIGKWFKTDLGSKIASGLLLLVLGFLWNLNGDVRELKGTLHGFATQIDAVSSDVKGLKTDVSSLRSQVDFLNGEFVAQRLAAAAQDPQNPRSTRDAKNILAGLREKRVKVDPSIIEGAGSKLIASSARSDDAWEVVGKLLDYRSFLAEEDILGMGEPTPLPKEAANYKWSINPATPPVNGRLEFVISQVGGLVPVEQSARLEALSSPNQTGSGIRTFVVDGQGHGLMLDDMRMEHVVVRNAIVVYNGGPVRLLDVRFVDCEFRMRRITRAVELAQTLLRPAPATFSSAET
ncbi:MAG: hypothetical protein DMG35_03795 [Acidobacteria bacterium]|nr:MAG: hypothetical protein DMG35_03795 [Acidobacteriota bacterium]